MSADPRVPVRLGPIDAADPDEALLVENDARVPDGRTVARFRLAPAQVGHPPLCPCCRPRNPVGQALRLLFLSRARGELPFFRAVLAVPATPAGDPERAERGSSLRRTLPAGGTLTAPRRSRTNIGRMRVLVVYCHPVAESFAAAAHATVLQALAERGHEVTDLDLYAEGFDPVMSRQDRIDYQNTARNIRPVKKYDEQLEAAEALVLVYPAWWYGMPAMLKGWFDRVWLPGVAFDVSPDGRVLTDRLKSLRRIVVVTTYGGPWWMVRIAMGDPARKVIGRAVRGLCARDCRVDWYIHYHMDRARPEQLRRFLERIRNGLRRL